MRIIITGGSGLLGTQLVHLCLETGHQVFSAYSTHPPAIGNPVRLDLTDSRMIHDAIERIRPDVIIHAAAVTDVDLCEERPELAYLINGEGTGKIGEEAKGVGAHVIYVSTDYVFDGRTGSYREDEPPNPVNHYGRSKLLGERLLRESCCHHCIARTSVIYGWGREHRPNFGTWVLSTLQSNRTIKAVMDQYVSPTLNENLAEMLVNVVDMKLERVLHVAGSTRIDRYNFALKIAEIFQLDPNLVEPVKAADMNWRAQRPADSSLDVEKAMRLLDRKPLKLSDALERFRAGQVL